MDLDVDVHVDVDVDVDAPKVLALAYERLDAYQSTVDFLAFGRRSKPAWTGASGCLCGWCRC